MARYALRRLAAFVPLLLGVVTLVFVLVATSPGRPADVLLGDRPVPPDVRRRVEEAYGLDLPAPKRCVLWVRAVVLHGDLGWSISRSRPVAEVLADALPPTLLLAGAALAIHVLSGLGLGVAAARWRGRWPDRMLAAASLALYSMPAFWLGIMSVLAFSYAFPVFPAASMRSVGADVWIWPRRALDVAWHLALPASVLGLASAASLGRFIRGDLAGALDAAFVRAARSRGAGRRRALWRHALRASLLPGIHLVGLALPALVSGSLAVEVVFAWPGMGRLAYDAILARDVPVIMACTLLATVVAATGSLLADLAAAAVDPRIRLGARGVGP